jgi:hypothetical protein
MRKFFTGIFRIITITAICLAAFAFIIWAAVRQPNFGKYEFPDSPRTDKKTLRKHVDFLSSAVFPRNPRHAEQLNRAADYIRSELGLSRARVSEQTYIAEGKRYRNIIARLGPAKGRLIVIGAHYDVCGDTPGADDNASGVAGLLELARLLGGRSLSSPVELVAFSTEEPHFFGSDLMGSAVHARSLRTAGIEVAAMISLEMIGFYSEKQLDQNPILRLIYPGRGDFEVVVGRWDDRALAREIKKGMRGAGDLPVFSYSGPLAIGADLSDHRNYWTEGYPAVMVTDTAHLRNPNYHTEQDSAETLDYGRMATVVDGVFNAVVRLQSAMPR